MGAQAILFNTLATSGASAFRYRFTTMSSTGTLKKFFQEKGFGFITPDDGSEDVFVHVKDNPDLGEDCQGGESVTYDTEWNDRKGKSMAVNCTVSGGGGGGGGGGKGGKGKGKGGDR